jgi:hypothetical protein
MQPMVMHLIPNITLDEWLLLLSTTKQGLRARMLGILCVMAVGLLLDSSLLVNKVFVMYPCYLVGSQFRSRHVNPMQMSFLQEGTE